MSPIRVDKSQSSIILRGPNKPFSKVLPLPTILRLPAASASAASRVCAMNSKAWWASKTIWLNAITAGIATLTALQGQAIVAEHPKAAAAIVAGLGLLNIGLRIVSVLPIGG